MDKQKAIEYLENSFLKPLLFEEEITDISYNGSTIYFVSNLTGRQKSNIEISLDDAKSFIRQIANLTEKQFSYQDPYLDTSFSKYRINAVHGSIAKRNNDNSLTFSVRISSTQNRVLDDKYFISDKLRELFRILIKNRQSIVISGVTGSGKTEFQKYLFQLMEKDTRVIVIDNIQELENISYDDIDMSYWMSDDNNPNATTSKLVKNALRSNPDWLIVAESRGEEMVNVLNSAMTGHPIITTLHSKDSDSCSNRMVRMILNSDKDVNPDYILQDILYHFNIYVYLEKSVDENGQIKRYISSVLYKDNKYKQYLFERINNKEHFHEITKNIEFLHEKLSNLNAKGNDNEK